VKLVLASNGSYPRSGDTPELQVLQRTLQGLSRREKTAADLADAQKEMTRCAIAEQVQAGIEVLTDGLIRWPDPVSHVAGRLRGVRLGEPAAYFATGRTYRKPIVVSRPVRNPEGHSELVEEFRFARNALGRLPTAREREGKLSVKPILTGPYTLARLSESHDPAYASVEARASAFADALGGELRALLDAGAALIQVDEPAIARFPEDCGVLAAALGPLLEARDAARKSGREVRLALCVNLGDAEPFYEKLIQLPVDALLLDFAASPRLAVKVAAVGSPVPLGLGVVDGRRVEMEDTTAVARQVEPVLAKLNGAQAFLGPSCGLESLPRDRAYAKLELLGQIRAKLLA
jgi:5-methyltetrahydropteroyltriglutamate--homocysteine methyltransferase